jgi:hypothetical protein
MVVMCIMVLFLGTLYFPLAAVDPFVEGASAMQEYANSIWFAWTCMADPGTQADRENFAQRVAGGIISLMGIVFFAIVLAFTVDIVREKLERLKRGTGGVVEEGHTLILGYSDKALLVARYARTLVDFSMISVSFAR